jgi:hypothetical protein
MNRIARSTVSQQKLAEKFNQQFPVGTNGKGEVVVNHPNLDVDAAGCGHIVFSPEQALSLAELLRQSAAKADSELRAQDAEGQK